MPSAAAAGMSPTEASARASAASKRSIPATRARSLKAPSSSGVESSGSNNAEALTSLRATRSASEEDRFVPALQDDVEPKAAIVAVLGRSDQRGPPPLRHQR